jgi:preprotein translocase subunit SecF
MFKKTPTFDFMGRTRTISTILSLVLVIGSILLVATRGLNLALDFTGGTEIEVQYPQPVVLEDVRSALANSEFGEAVVQHFGKPTDVLVRVPPHEDAGRSEIGNRLIEILKKKDPAVELRRVEDVGPQVGEELRDKSGAALVYSVILLLIYTSLRFKFKFGVGAILALMHDPIIILGFFALTQMTFDLSALAAVLAVLGYSINDTIVVYDRVREVFRETRKGEPAEVMNLALNQTLDRTTLTSLATLLVVVALAIFGGPSLEPFAWTLIVGIVAGTYSSIYVACSVTLAMKVTREDFMETERTVDKDMP